MSNKKAKPTSSRAKTKASEASRRERLAAQREAEQKRQRRNTLIGAIVAGVLALAVIAVVAVVVIQNQSAKREQAEREAAAQIAPPNAVDESAILVNPDTGADAQYTLNLYVDYQCGVCKQTEEIYGETWKALMDEGFLKVEVHTMTFMDDQPSLNNDHSRRVAVGAACADTRGKYWEFHNAAFNRQGEGQLYTDSAMDGQIAQDAGLEGADFDAWKTCYDDNATAQFVDKVNENAGRNGVTSTPTIMVNGKNPQVEGDGRMTDWWRVLDANTDAWKKAIEDAANS
ncbi:DsbA family protein [Propionibacteriaceae bacterium Y1923]